MLPGGENWHQGDLEECSVVMASHPEAKHHTVMYIYLNSFCTTMTMALVCGS